MKFNRRKTRQIQIGKVGIGSDFPISVQSMTTTKTKDVESTLSQIYELASNGADIVRVTLQVTLTISAPLEASS